MMMARLRCLIVLCFLLLPSLARAQGVSSSGHDQYDERLEHNLAHARSLRRNQLGESGGRALAGASGDTDARIFCSRLEAELVSIAGRYLISEQLPADHQGSSVQIALVDDRLTVTRN